MLGPEPSANDCQTVFLSGYLCPILVCHPLLPDAKDTPSYPAYCAERLPAENDKIAD